MPSLGDLNLLCSECERSCTPLPCLDVAFIDVFVMAHINYW